MADHPLIELSRARIEMGSMIVMDDYTTQGHVCRSGLWIGLRTDLVETVVLSYEHDTGANPEPLYVGWAINGVTVSDPGYPGDLSPDSWLGRPAPGAASVKYVTPVDDLFHRISLRSTGGVAKVCPNIQVLYRYPSEAGAPYHRGPSTTSCVTGCEVVWPHDKLEEERRCWRRLQDLVERFIEVVPVGPGPVEQWLTRANDDDLRFIHAGFETLGNLHPERDAALDAALKARLAATITRLRMPGAALGSRSQS
jgi:hypothetical protein